MAVLRIAGVEVAPPTDLRVTRFDLTKTERAASGRLVSEIIRPDVRRLTVTWEYLPDPLLREILDLLAAFKPFVDLEYEDAGKIETMTAAVEGEIEYGMAHKVRGVRYWSHISIAFVER